MPSRTRSDVLLGKRSHRKSGDTAPGEERPGGPLGGWSNHAEVLHLQQTVGNQAVLRLLSGGERRQPSDSLPLRVQRLMTLADFKKATPATPGSLRNKVKSVDQAVKDYARLPKDATFTTRDERLDKILTACNRYLSLPDKTAKRKPGVRQLRAEVNLERRVVVDLAKAEQENDPVKKFRNLAAAREHYLEVQPLLGTHTFYLSDRIETETIACINSVRNTSEERELIQDDLDKLRLMQSDPKLPRVVRDVLEEVLGNVDQVRFEESLPGAKLSNEGVREKYTVKHALNQPLGEAERMGSLTHELTHVSIGEKFGNTPVFLAFKRGAPEDEIMELVERRGERLDEIEIALENDQHLNNNQKLLVGYKVRYGKANSLGKYAADYYNAKRIGWATQGYINKLAKIANNAVIEYDTVINQMLVYMARWNVPTDNALYTKIREVAQEAFEYRRNL